MSDRESLRPVIAEILDGLATSLIEQRRPGFLSLVRGADTLRWTHAYEETPTHDEVTELEHLRELVGGIESALDMTTRTGKPVHPGVVRKRVAELLVEAGWPS